MIPSAIQKFFERIYNKATWVCRKPARNAKLRRYREWNARQGTSINQDTIVEPSAELRFGPVSVGQIQIGAGSHLDSGTLLATFGGSILLGKRVYVGPYSVVYGHGGVVLGDNVIVSSHVSIMAMNHLFADLGVPIRDQGERHLGISIESDVWIGTGARILDGVTIGRGSVVGAGAVVTRSLPAFSVAVGVPAAVIYDRVSKANA